MTQIKSLKTGIKFKDTPIGKVPVDWEVTQLGSIAQVRRGASPRPINDPKWFDGLSKEVDRKFLCYYLQRTEHKFTAKSQRGTQGNLSTSIISITYLPLPPLPEQKKIAETLSNVDDAIEETDRIFEKTKELKKGFMQERLVPLLAVKEQNKISDILSSIDLEIENEVKHKEELETLKKSLMQVLLTGKVRVKVG